MRRLRRNVCRHGMVERVCAQLDQRGDGSDADEAVEQYRDAGVARCKSSSENGGKLAPAERGCARQRIVEQRRMAGEARVDRGLLSRQALIVDTGAATRPARAAAAEQRRRDGRRSRGIADPHLTEADEVRAGRDGVVAGRDRGEERVLAHGRCLREVCRGFIERERNDAQVCADGSSELIDGRAAGGEIRHHLGSDLGVIGGHALFCHAVVARKHENFDPIEAWHAALLPLRKPHDDVFEPPEAAGWLGELALTLGCRRRSFGICGRQIQTGRAKIIERREERRSGCATAWRWPPCHDRLSHESGWFGLTLSAVVARAQRVLKGVHARLRRTMDPRERAYAGNRLFQSQWLWIPAFAGMTAYELISRIAEQTRRRSCCDR